MAGVHKRVVTDKQDRPIAVQIDYADWVALEDSLGGVEYKGRQVSDLSKHAGVMSHALDPLEYQDRIRGEWQ